MRFDSGPYLSLAHNLAAHARLVSNFNFVGNFGTLPSVPNFIVPAFGLLIGAIRPLTTDLIAAGAAVLLGSLVLSQLFATRIVARCTGHRRYALVTGALLVWDPRTAALARSILTELPFTACLLGATLAALVVIQEGSGGRRARLAKWLGLPLASGFLCLTRYIGIFFPLALSGLWLARALGARGPERPRLGATVAYLVVYNAIAMGPVVLWLLAARLGGAPLVPSRPPSLLSLWTALRDAATFVAAWAAPWVAVGALFLVTSRGSRPRSARGDWRLEPAEWLLGLIGLAYVVLLIAIRTRVALFPFRSLGTRYMVPAWPLVFLLLASLFYRLVWAPGDPRTRRLTRAAAAVAFAVQAALVVESKPMGVPFPMETQTYRMALDLVGSRDVVLTNYGQLFCHARPEARIISVPSRVHFNYELDLPKLVARHGVRWAIVFDEPAEAASFPDLVPWLHAPPPGVGVARTWRLGDGVIYELAG